jgi:hypothetical protein
MPDRPVKIQTEGQRTRVNEERTGQHFDEQVRDQQYQSSALEARIASLETRLTDAEARLTAHSI